MVKTKKFSQLVRLKNLLYVYLYRPTKEAKMGNISMKLRTSAGKLCGAFLLSMSFFSFGVAVNWSPPVNLSAPDRDALAAQVEVANGKQCVALWSKFDGTYFRLQSAQGSIGTGWSFQETISHAVGHAFFGQLALDQQGNPMAVWAQNINGTSVIQSSDLNLFGWSNPVTISVPGNASHKATKPQIATTGTGYDFAIWQKNNGINNVIQVTSRKGNRIWAAPQDLTVATSDGLGDIDPQIAVDSHGNAIAVWRHDGTQTIRASLKVQNAGWLPHVTISDSWELISSPQVAFDTLGNAVVVWSRSDGTNRLIQAASFNINGHLIPPVTLSLPGLDANNPQIAVDSGGNVMVVWQRSDGVNTIIESATRQTIRTGFVWSAPIDLSVAGDDASDPQVYASSQRLVAVTWKRSDGSNFIIQTTTKIPGYPWTPPVSISAAGEDATHPQIAVDNLGNIVSVWERNNGQNNVVQSSFGLTK
jgi:hypothetical protein